MTTRMESATCGAAPLRQRTVERPVGIRPRDIAFDIDGVVADTMQVFVDLARTRYGLTHLRKDHLICYNLYQCVPAPAHVIDDLICLTLDDDHTLRVPAMEGAAEVLTRLAGYGPLRFVTARIWPESIVRWLQGLLPEVPAGSIQVTATGDPEVKHRVLREMGVRYFVEDRLETCRLLADQGFVPILFDQPWNQEGAPFPRIYSWSELNDLLAWED
ncbi:MAG: haloacid dehalogenase [Desulfacinum sp.]|nr:haloacid dehalogenase [Desulfacinum sp.]